MSASQAAWRRTVGTRAERNLRDWIQLHRLPPHFPVLTKDPPDSEVFLRHDGAEVREILDSILGSPRTMVIFGDGRGATTICKAMVRSAYTAAVRSMSLFVVIDPSLHLDEAVVGDPTEALSRSLVEQILHSLCVHYWEKRLYAERRAHLYSILGVSDEMDLDDLRLAIETDPRAPRFAALIERHCGTPLSLVANIHRNINISTCLVFDVSSAADEEIIYAMVRAVKWIDQTRPTDMSPAALSEVYFLSNDVAGLVTSLWQRDYQRIGFPDYSLGEFFAILATRFHARLGNTPTALTSVLAQDLVRAAWGPDTSLLAATERLRALMLELCDVPPGDVEYVLHPHRRSTA